MPPISHFGHCWREIKARTRYS